MKWDDLTISFERYLLQQEAMKYLRDSKVSESRIKIIEKLIETKIYKFTPKTAKSLKNQLDLLEKEE